MKRTHPLSFMIVIIVGILAISQCAVSAEETGIICTVLRDGYQLEQFLAAPSAEILAAHGTRSIDLEISTNQRLTEQGNFAYEKKLINWMNDHYSEIAAEGLFSEKSSSQIRIHWIIPGFIPSFLWIDSEESDGCFVSCSPSSVNEDPSDESIHIYTPESFRETVEKSRRTIKISIGSETDSEIDGLQYPGVTMVPVKDVIELYGGVFCWDPVTKQAAVSCQENSRKISFDNSSLSGPDERTTSFLLLVPFGSTYYLWSDEENVLWMDIDSARRLLKYVMDDQ